ncbi:MAG: carboxypeptidase-like regulatory domain-containing protein [Bacteroidales bacterium]|nr:carboxypeptidase-like regulatory domain-containing protein [Bacteroidales bacterium]
MKTYRKLLLFCALFVSLLAYGQTDTLRYSVRGTVRDAAGGKPLAYVSVTLPGTNYATVTNQDGSFVIKSDLPPRFVAFSLLGYKTLTVPADREQMMRVSLNRGEFTLDPAQIISGDPLTILREAIYKIPENCPSEPELFECFYRETAQKRNRFIYVSEAVTKMYKSSFRNVFGRDRTAVEKSRLLTSPRRSDTLAIKVIGGPTQAVDLDLVKTRSVILNDSDLEDYRLEMLEPVMLDDRRQLVIKLTPTLVSEFAQQHGIVYIDQETMSFTRIEMSLDMSDPAKATRVMLVRKPADIRFKPKEMSLLLNYKREDGKSRLSYVRTVFRFNCDARRHIWNTEFTAIAEMVVTNRFNGADAVPIDRAESFRSSESLADKTQVYADPDFWKDYNIIEPTESLEHALGRLRKEE